METFSMLVALCDGIPLATNGFSSQRPINTGFHVSFGGSLKEQLKKSVGLLVIWDAMGLILTSL